MEQHLKPDFPKLNSPGFPSFFLELRMTVIRLSPAPQSDAPK